MTIQLEYQGYGIGRTRAEQEQDQLVAARAHLALVSLLKKYGCPIVDGTPVVAAVDKWLNRLCAPCEVCCKPQNEPCPVPMMSPVPSEQSVVFSVLRRLDALEKRLAALENLPVTPDVKPGATAPVQHWADQYGVHQVIVGNEVCRQFPNLAAVVTYLRSRGYSL